jgi:hypothetical protein
MHASCVISEFLLYSKNMVLGLSATFVMDTLSVDSLDCHIQNRQLLLHLVNVQSCMFICYNCRQMVVFCICHLGIDITLWFLSVNLFLCFIGLLVYISSCWIKQ